MKRYVGTIHAYQDYNGKTFHGPMKPVRLPTGYCVGDMPRAYNINVYLK
jgi:hypothetical protein